MMIELPISKDQIKRARELYDFKNLKGSITGGKSNIFGAIGEIVVLDHFKEMGANLDQTYDYDIVIKDVKVDVKTKRTTVAPRDNYLCSISAFNTTQKCHVYFFVRVKTDLVTAYLLGYKRKSEFFAEAFFKKKGDQDVNGFIFKDDCYNMEISKLNKFKYNGKKNKRKTKDQDL